MKRLTVNVAAVLAAAILLMPCQTYAVSAQYAVLMDGRTGRILYDKGADERSLIASTTKIMTALIICEQCNVLDRMRVPKEAVGIEGSSMYLREGEVLTLQELLYGLMLSSGNDAAVALAIYCGGTVEGFAQLMNDKARQLGMKDTHFENPNGLDSPGHYSTARDLAVLASYAMENPIFAKTVSAKTVTIGNRSLRNHNKLLWQVEGADGVKTGYTKAAGRILVSSAVRNGRRLICVTINAPNDWNDHALLLNDGFSHYTMKTLISVGDPVGRVSLMGGEEDYVDLLSAEEFKYPMADGERLSLLLSGPGFAFAPVAEGERAGYAHVMLDGKAVGKIEVFYSKTVERQKEPERSFWHRLFGGDEP